MDSISGLALFRTIVESGGISAAARRLQSSPPAVSRGLASLEARLGVRLADRSSRRFNLTDEGALLYERSRVILDQLRDAEAEVAARGGRPRGLVRIGATSEYGRRHVGPAVAAAVAANPGLEAKIILSDAGLDVGEDACDLILRIGRPDDQGLMVRKIAATRRLLCASPDYLARHGTPRAIEDLANHNCLCLARRHRLDDVWQYSDGTNHYDVKVSGTLSSSSGDLLHQWARDGHGISLEALWDVADDLAAGHLVEVLPGYSWADAELFAAFAPGKPVPPRIRFFVDYFAKVLGSAGCAVSDS
jgi:LysR family transcriptional regulator, transcriptional activator for dmlA